jgi:hypothetical protein
MLLVPFSQESWSKILDPWLIVNLINFVVKVHQFSFVPECDEYIRIFEYWNILGKNIYLDIPLFQFFFTNIFRPSFVWFMFVANIFGHSFVSVLFCKN